MPCALTTNIILSDCLDSAGGVKMLRVAKLSDIATITSAAGVVSAITMQAGKKFFQYQMKKETGEATETENVSDENGSTFYDHKVSIALNKLEAAKRNELRLLAQSNVVVIIEDNAGNHLLFGCKNGLNKSGTAMTGKAYGDRNGYTLEFTGKELEPMLFVNQGILAAITQV